MSPYIFVVSKNFKINSLVHLESCLVSNQNSRRIAFVDILSPIQIEISLVVKESCDDLHCGFNILDNYGRVSFGTTTSERIKDRPPLNDI